MFLSNHADVLLCIAEDSKTRMRDIASNLFLTERAVQRFIAGWKEDS